MKGTMKSQNQKSKENQGSQIQKSLISWLTQWASKSRKQPNKEQNQIK